MQKVNTLHSATQSIKTKTGIAILCFFILGIMPTVQAQVTIGSGIVPEDGALLDMKETDSPEENSTKGVKYPRVALIKIDELYPMYGEPSNENASYTADKANLKKSHTGLVVFNTTINSIPTPDKDTFTPGLHIWDGAFWKSLDSRLAIAPDILELRCASATLSPAQYTQGVPYSGTLIVPYIGGNGGEYGSHTITTTNGLTATLQPGNLAIGNGSLYYSVEGTPIESSPVTTEFVIDDFLGQSCSAIVGDKDEVKVMEYARLYITPLPNPPAPGYDQFLVAYSQSVRFGNIKVRYLKTRYRYPLIVGGAYEEKEFIQFAPAETATNATYSYTKHGSGGLNYAAYGQALLKIDQFITPEGKEFDGVNMIQIGTDIVGNDGDRTYTINSANRDFAILMVSFHNTKEIYRVSFNINGSIPATGVTEVVTPSLTLFVEKLE